MIGTARSSIAAGSREIGFLIVGTPRSGTTLVQRLATELPGVRVPPETHFFPQFGWDLIHRSRFPLDAGGIEQEIRRYKSLTTSRGMDLDPGQVVADLEGSCTSALELFQAIVRSLAGTAEMYGEKTPNHLLWWKPLSTAISGLRIVVVVRDPRAVTSSYASAPFGMDSPAALAESWSADQREALHASAELGPDRCLIVRYEDVVHDPEESLEKLRVFLGRPSAESAEHHVADGPAPEILMPWETWKANALRPVMTSRVEAWRTELSPRDANTVAVICKTEMRALGYQDEPDERKHTRRPLSLSDRWRRWHFKIARARKMRAINGTSL
jgi:hypothetical protein